MPSVGENLEKWGSYAWEHRGEEWSFPWGSSAFQWAITIYPRIMQHIPTDNVVEIAPGFGRWVPFLLRNCKSYIGVDISERCTMYCERTFGQLSQRPQFLTGNGKSLSGIRDSDTDFVFSFDSLVHAELDCLSAYAGEIFRVLRPGGSAFIHHSNIAALEAGVANPGWRGSTVSAERAEQVFIESGLNIRVLERLPWVFGGELTDCFALLHKPLRGEIGRKTQHLYNTFFSNEFSLSCQLAGAYGMQLEKLSEDIPSEF